MKALGNQCFPPISDQGADNCVTAEASASSEGQGSWVGARSSVPGILTVAAAVDFFLLQMAVPQTAMPANLP